MIEFKTKYEKYEFVDCVKYFDWDNNEQKYTALILKFMCVFWTLTIRIFLNQC